MYPLYLFSISPSLSLKKKRTDLSRPVPVR